MTATVTVRRWKGSYAARITASGDTALHRDWCPRENVKGTAGAGSSTIIFTLEGAGWYEYRQGGKWQEGRVVDGHKVEKRYLRVTVADGMKRLDGVTLEDMVAAVGGPPPGEPGEWRSERCECGQEVYGYTEVGFPHCQDHAPAEIHRVPDELAVTA